MRGREKPRAKVEREKDVENDERASQFMVVVSSDDEEANEDLSLKIVEKALLMRAAKRVRNDDVSDASAGVSGGDVGLIASSSRESELAVVPNDDIFDRAKGVAASGVVLLDNGESKIAIRKKKAKKVDSGDRSVIIAQEQEIVETQNVDEIMEPGEASTVQMGDNMVLRKLLRGPRYFDPPDSGWGTCFNCGEEGHSAVNCTAAKRKKPCFVCGNLGHSAKHCTMAQDCFICKKGGHRAKDCPEKQRGGSKSSAICLKCGNFGHDMFSCKNDYPPDDLKEIQCYVCKRFGHLCCVDAEDATPVEISCYKCGQLGHTGLACARLHRETTGAATPSSCYKCGEEGHFARECTSSAKASARLHGENTDAVTPSSCYKCGEGGHFARECTNSAKAYGGKRNREISGSRPSTSRFHKEKDYVGYRSAPHDMGQARKKKKVLAEEKGTTTPQKSKRRGGWITEHPGEFSPVKYKGNSWRSPATPSTRSTKICSFSGGSHTPSSISSKKFWKGPAGTSKSQGSSKGYQQRFSASRFGNSSNDGIRRTYDWW